MVVVVVGGSTSMTTSRGIHFHDHFGGVHFHDHFQRGVSTSMTTSGGVHFHDHFWGGGSTSMTTSGEGGGPMWPSHHPLDLTSLLSRHQLMGLACYSSLYTLLPQCIMGRSHGTPPPPPKVGQIDRQTRVNALPSHTTYAGGKNAKWAQVHRGSCVVVEDQFSTRSIVRHWWIHLVVANYMSNWSLESIDLWAWTTDL